MEALKLKITHSRTEIMSEALLHYAEISDLIAGNNTINKEHYEIRFSIAMQLYYLFKKMYNTRYAPKNHTIKMELHEAIVLQAALLFAINVERNDFVRNEMEIIKNKLHQKQTNLNSKTV